MYTLQNIEAAIMKKRQVLYLKIDEKDNLLDIEVITASQELDKALNEYNNLLSKVDK
jgi:hypothetical protein